jgi:hypothetical protein
MFDQILHCLCIYMKVQQMVKGLKKDFFQVLRAYALVH